MATEKIRISYEVDKKQLEASNKELKETAELNNLTQKEIDQTTEKFKNQETQLSKTNKEFSGLSSNLDKSTKKNSEFKSKISESIKEQEAFGVSVNSFSTKFGALTAAIGAGVAVLAGLVKAYASSARGAEDLARASDRLGAATRRLGNTLSDSLGDNFFDKLLASAEVYFLGLDSFIKGQLEVNVRAQLRREEIGEFELERQKKQLLQEAEILRQRRDEERNSIEDRKQANDDLFFVIQDREKLTVEFFKKRISSLNILLALDQDNLELQRQIKEAEFEIADAREEAEGFRSESLANDLALAREVTEDKLAIELARLEQQIIAETQFSERWIELQRRTIEVNKQLQLEAAGENRQRRELAIQEAINAELALSEALEQIEAERLENSVERIKEAEILTEEEKLKIKEDASRNLLKVVEASAQEEAEINSIVVDNREDSINSLIETTKNATKEGTELNKAAALAGIAQDTGKAISSLTAASEANPANAVTFGAAGVAQFATGLVRIFANVASAKNILSTAPKFEKGGRIGGNLHSSGGTLIEAERDEFVMSRKATNKYGFDFMEKLNNLELRPPTLYSNKVPINMVDVTPIKEQLSNMPQNIINIDSQGFEIHQVRGQNRLTRKLNRYST